MIKFENVKIYNWINAIRGMRNSWESWDKMDSYETRDGGVIIGPNDYSLMMRLSKAGNDHAKYMRQIFVSVDITAPEYWWKEYATYKIGTVENSTSQMHKLGSRLLTMDDFSFDDPNDPFNIETVQRVNQLVKEWWDAGKKKPSPEWRKLVQNIPQSYNYLRSCTLNYQVLKNMYNARKHHRLHEWRDFAQWVESLPCSYIITLDDRLVNDIDQDARNFVKAMCESTGTSEDGIHCKVVVVIDRDNNWWHRVILEGEPSWVEPLSKFLRGVGHNNVEVVAGQPPTNNSGACDGGSKATAD